MTQTSFRSKHKTRSEADVSHCFDVFSFHEFSQLEKEIQISRLTGNPITASTRHPAIVLRQVRAIDEISRSVYALTRITNYSTAQQQPWKWYRDGAMASDRCSGSALAFARRHAGVAVVSCSCHQPDGILRRQSPRKQQSSLLFLADFHLKALA